MPVILRLSRLDRGPVWKSCLTGTVPSRSVPPRSNRRPRFVNSVYIWTANCRRNSAYSHRGRVVLFSLTSSSPDLSACQRQSNDHSSCSLTNNVEFGLLQLCASWYTTRDNCTIATCAECHCSPVFSVGYSRACHSKPPSVTLAASPLAGPV